MALSIAARASRVSYGQIADKLEVGNLIQTQLDSFTWFTKEGLRELFDEIIPITDYTGKNYELRFLDYEFGDPKFDEEECRQRDMTFSVPLRINTRLYIKTGETPHCLPSPCGGWFRSWGARGGCTSPPATTGSPAAGCRRPSSSPTAAP